MSKQTSLLRLHWQRLQKKRRSFLLTAATIAFFGASLSCVIGMALWALIRPYSPMEHLLCGGLFFAVTLFYLLKGLPKKGQLSSLTADLEMKYPDASVGAFHLDQFPIDPSHKKHWHRHLDDHLEVYSSELFSNIRRRLKPILPIAIVAMVMGVLTAPSLSTAFDHVAKVRTWLASGASLHVVRGLAEADSLNKHTLKKGHIAPVELLPDNLVEIALTKSPGNRVPVAELRQVDSKELIQSFQMVESEGSNKQLKKFEVSFSTDQPLHLYLPHIDKENPLAMLDVKVKPVPKVTLATKINLPETWNDDRPLPLLIKAEGKHPLKKLSLVIQISGKEHTEVINRVMVDNLFEIKTEHDLLLESYMQSDLATVEIYAEAIDAALPTPLVGRSKTIRLQVASAYGRYRQTLRSLANIKRQLDLKEEGKSFQENVENLLKKANDQSTNSPFFDGLDRQKIRAMTGAIQQKLQRNAEDYSEEKEELSQFLFEHETIDDRERDRDFFVAARGLSRLLEKEPSKRPVTVSTVTDRISNFLKDRQQRWQQRVSRLQPEEVPAEWPKIEKEKPFTKAMEDISINKDSNSSLETLSKAVNEYRNWIEKLENAEEDSRKKQEAQRQKGIASAQNEIKELQKTQSKVSQFLDQSDSRDSEELSSKWPSTRMKQNGNQKAAQRLQGKMRSLSPQASKRLQAAAQAMAMATESGNSKQFGKAESASDFAARLLRQANNAANQSKRKQSRRQRRKRVSGDNYHGQTVVGGDVDIQREYEVDQQYRETILEEALGAPEADKKLLEDYLRQIVR